MLLTGPRRPTPLTPPPSEKVRDEMNTVMRWFWSFFRLTRTCRYTGASCSKANSQSSPLCTCASCKGVLRVFTAEYGSESTSKSHSSWRSSLKWGNAPIPYLAFHHIKVLFAFRCTCGPKLRYCNRWGGSWVESTREM